MTNPIHSLLKAAICFGERRMQVNGGVINSVADGRKDQRFVLAMRYFSWKKMFNFIRVELQLRCGRRKASGLPYEWEIDTTNICQLSCPLCHTGLGTIHREKGVMHYDVFTKTIDQIKDHCVWLTLYSWGEPFLNKRIHEFVAYAHQNRIATIISSNLNKPLTPEMAESIIMAGLDTMIVSMDGVTQDVYEIYRVGGHLDRVLDNIRLLVKKKKELGRSNPHLEWQFIVMRQNEHQIPAARALADELGMDSIVFKNVDFPHGADEPDLAEQWLPRNHPQYLRADPFYKPYNENGQRCWRLWRSAVVNWDGGFAPCCYLTDKSQDFGDVNGSSIKEIWNNDEYHTARGLFRDGYTPSKWVGCLSCSVYLGSKAAKIRGEVFVQGQPLNIVFNGTKNNGINNNGNGNNGNGRTPDSVPVHETSIRAEAPEEKVKR